MLLRAQCREWDGAIRQYIWRSCFILQLDTMQRKATIACPDGQLDTASYNDIKLARSHIPLFDDEKET